MKVIFLYLCKYCGLFTLSNYLLRRKLLILCYHAFEIIDESRFRPQLFTKKATFERRLNTLRRSSAQVISLEDAVSALEDDSLPDNSVVITVDDGFYSVYSIAYPLIRRFNYPATIYQTTMDMLKEKPIAHLLVGYMIETSRVSEVDLSGYEWGPNTQLNLSVAKDRKDLAERCLSHAEELATFEELEIFYKELGVMLYVDYETVRDSKLLTLMSESEVRMLSENEFDIQLHTHTHRFPQDDRTKASFEIQKNREVLERLANKPLQHFCYPSGQWSTLHWPILEDLGIKSATTCTPGLNDSTTHLLALNRFLDGENIPDIVFEAELYRFNELIRRFKHFFRKNTAPVPVAD